MRMKLRRTVRLCPPTRKSLLTVRGCPQEWERLDPTADEQVRHCRACNEDVHFCSTDEATLTHALAGHCVARDEPDGSELPHLVVGRALLPEPTAQQKEARRNWKRERGIEQALSNDLDSIDRRCPECGYPVPEWRKTCYVCQHPLGRA